MKIIVCSGANEFCNDISIIKREDILYNNISYFEDNEMLVKLDDYKNVKNEDILVIQSISNNVNNKLIELLFIIDILNTLDVKSIKVLLTYAGYSRQDTINNINESYSFKIISKMLSQQNISKIYLIDIHSAQTTGFFNIPCENILTQDFICNLIKNQFNNPLLISPDVGNIKNIIKISHKLNIEYNFAIKYRPKANENKILSLIGSSVENKDCIIIDDIIDSAGTLCNVAEKLVKNGANNVIAYITHPVLSKKSFERIKNSYITKLYITNTINVKDKIQYLENKVQVFSISNWILSKILN